MVKALPATPAMPHPSANVPRSTRSVLMPTAPAIVRFCTTARTCRPQRERYMSSATAPVISRVSAITNKPLIGTSIVSVSWSEPIIQSGSSTPTSRAPKVER